MASTYQARTGLRCWLFAGGAVFAPDTDTAIAYAVEHGLMDADASSQLSLDAQAARAALVAHTRHERRPPL